MRRPQAEDSPRQLRILARPARQAVTGHGQDRRVSDFWGGDITSYEWVHVVAADRVPVLTKLLGGHEGDDVLALFCFYYQRVGGHICDIMKHPDVAEHFANWHS